MKILHIIQGEQFEDKIQDNILRWLGHVFRRKRYKVFRRSDGVKTNNKDKGKIKETWLEMIMNELNIWNLTEGLS